MNKKILTLSLQFFSVLAFADGLSDSVEKSYSDAAKAAEAVSEAAAQIELASKTVNDGRKILDEVLIKVNKLKYDNLNLTSKIEANGEEISKSLKDYQTFLGEYKNLEDSASKLSSVLPLGKDRIEYARALIKSAKKLAEKNPGDNYQDLKYVNFLAEQYENKVANLNRLQKDDFSAASINLKMCGPHLEGIKTSLDMAEDFNSKARNLCSSNAKNAEEIMREYSRLSESLSGYYSQYLDAHRKLSQEADNISDAIFKLSIFALNELPKSSEYKNAVFRNAEELRLNIPQARPISASMKYKNPQLLEKVADAAKYASAASNFQRAAADTAYESVSKSAGNLIPKGLRKDILETAAKIAALTKEIANAEFLIRQRIEKISELALNIKSLHTLSSATLNSCINDFASAQTSAAATEMASGIAKISEMQFEVIETQIKKSFKTAEEKTKEAESLAESMQKNLESAKSELN